MAGVLHEDEHEQYSLRGRILQKIREDIASGRYPPGENLNETRLAEEFHVSRTPIREAIRQLEIEGFVRYVTNKGAIVEAITPRDVEEIFAIREFTERLAARWAAERITDEEIRTLAEIVQLMEFYTAKEDIDQLVRLDTRFHHVLVEASKSRPLKQAVGAAIHYIQRARYASLKVPGRLDRSLGEHKAILQALENRDPAEAERLASLHISRTRENLMSHTLSSDTSGFPH